MANTIQHKRGTEAEWTAADPTLAAGQVGVETDTGKFKIGNGSAAWSALGYFETAEAVAAYTFQGSNYGYTSGGVAFLNVIDKFPFAVDANATDVGDLTVGKEQPSGQSSAESGYTSGGYDNTPPGVYTSVIEKFPFASDANATNIGNLSQDVYQNQGNSSSENGYSVGGTTPGTTNVSRINKFPFAADESATYSADLYIAQRAGSGQSSSEYGYSTGGISPTGLYGNVIQKFPFAADTDAADVGDLTTGVFSSNKGQSSETHGYATSSTTGFNVQKFSFASDGNAATYGTVTSGAGAGQSSTEKGFISGGGSNITTIQKFSFVSDESPSNTGYSLTVGRSQSAGQQY